MRAFLIGTLASVALILGVSSNASADWRYRERARFEHGRRIVVRERYWAPVIVTTPDPVFVAPDPVFVAPAPAIVPDVVVAPGYGYYRPYYRGPRHFHHR